MFKTTNGWTGYSVEVFEYLAKTLDLQYEYIEQSSRMYGEMLPDGSWNGIIGQVSSKVSTAFFSRQTDVSHSKKCIKLF